MGWEVSNLKLLYRAGELPIIGINTLRNPKGDVVQDKLELARSTEDEKQSQPKRLNDFHTLHASSSPAMLKRLQQTVIANQNVFDVLMDAVRVCSLGLIPMRCLRWVGSIGAICDAFFIDQLLPYLPCNVTR